MLYAITYFNDPDKEYWLALFFVFEMGCAKGLNHAAAAATEYNRPDYSVLSLKMKMNKK